MEPFPVHESLWEWVPSAHGGLGIGVIYGPYYKWSHYSLLMRAPGMGCVPVLMEDWELGEAMVRTFTNKPLLPCYEGHWPLARRDRRGEPAGLGSGFHSDSEEGQCGMNNRRLVHIHGRP